MQRLINWLLGRSVDGSIKKFTKEIESVVKGQQQTKKAYEGAIQMAQAEVRRAVAGAAEAEAGIQAGYRFIENFNKLSQ